MIFYGHQCRQFLLADLTGWLASVHRYAAATELTVFFASAGIGMV